MQGQSGGVGSLPETLNFDHGSSSGNTAVEQQICWNNALNPSENRISDYLLLQQSDVNLSYVNAVGRDREQDSLARWSEGEPSSSGAAIELGCDERKAELGWTLATPCVGDCQMLDDLRYGASNNFPLDNVSVNPHFIQGSNSDAIPPNLSLNTGYISHNVTECPITFKTSGLENEEIPPTSGSDNFISPFDSSILSLEGSDGRPGSSMVGRRLSCKRKAFEGSTVGGSTSYSHSTDKTVVPSCSNASTNFVLSAPPDQANQRLRIGVREGIPDVISNCNVAGTTENAHRNFHMRISSANQSGSTHPNTASSGRSRHSGISSSQAPDRLLSVNYSPNLRSAPSTDNATTQNPPFVLRVPALPRSMLSSRVSGERESLHSRMAGSFGLVGDRHDMEREDATSSSTARIILENTLFVPATESRNQTRNPPSRHRHGGNLIIPGNAPSMSRTRSTMVTHPSSGSWLPHENSLPPQFPTRLSEYVRQQLFSSTLDSGGGQPNNLPSLNSGPFSQDMLLSGAGNRGHHSSLPRGMPRIERQGEGALGIPYSLRSVAAPGEGSGGHRLVSERIRNVLGFMRRGENLRIEDVMILDQSVLFGVADFHDRHRDMRLDVDDMSYEELLALEERIGNVSTGLSENTILTCLKQSKCAPVSGSPMEEEPCCICQEEYIEGEDVGKLDCGHDYHTGCIKQWLMIKNVCPICKTTALPT